MSLVSYQRSGNIRCDAAAAALFVDRKQGVDVILPLLQDKLDYVRYHACGLLHDFGDEQAIGPLIQCMKSDPSPQVRGIAAYALGGIGNNKATPALKETAKNDHEVDQVGYTPSFCAQEAIKDIQRKSQP